MGIPPNQEVQEGDEAETTLKYCIECDALHPISDFRKHYRSRDGYESKCRKTMQKKYNSYYKKLREAARRIERAKARSREYYRAHAAEVSRKNAAKRAAKKTYRTKWNPDAVRPEER